MFEDAATTSKVGFLVAVGTFIGGCLIAVIRFGNWVVGKAHEHEQLVEHMNATKPMHLEFPAMKQKVEFLEQNHDGLLDEVKGLRKEINDLFKFLIEKHGE